MFWSLAAILSMAASVLGAQPQSDTYQQLLRQGIQLQKEQRYADAGTAGRLGVGALQRGSQALALSNPSSRGAVSDRLESPRNSRAGPAWRGELCGCR